MRGRAIVIGLLGPVAAAWMGGLPLAAESDTDVIIESVERYVDNFNTRDANAWSATMHFPHVVISDGQVVVYGSRDAALEVIDIETFAETTGWQRSEIDAIEVLQADQDKAHVSTRVSRFGEEGDAYASFDGLFVVEKQRGRWAVRAYSRMALEQPDDW